VHGKTQNKRRMCVANINGARQEKSAKAYVSYVWHIYNYAMVRRRPSVGLSVTLVYLIIVPGAAAAKL